MDTPLQMHWVSSTLNYEREINDLQEQVALLTVKIHRLKRRNKKLKRKVKK